MYWSPPGRWGWRGSSRSPRTRPPTRAACSVKPTDRERLTAAMAHDDGPVFLSVRFGNVLGSRGSVLTTFAEQLVKGLPVTVTDPDVTRFMMTIPEAVQLVIQAAAIGGPGEALVLDMGARSALLISPGN